MARMGMDTDEVRRIAGVLDREAVAIETIIATLNREVGALAAAWDGPDAQQFANEWWPEHRRTLTVAKDSIAGLSRAALHNAKAQEDASGRV